jgi:hypothetical protein
MDAYNKAKERVEFLKLEMPNLPTVEQANSYNRAMKYSPKKKEPPSDTYKQKYDTNMKIANNTNLNSTDSKKATYLSNLFIVHAQARINELREKLTNHNTIVILPGNNENNEHYLGKGLAVEQWEIYNGKNEYGNTLPIIRIVAWKLFIDSLTNELTKLYQEFPYQVIYDTFARENANEFNIIVWGANSDNVEGDTGHVINGSGQAAILSPYGPGIFGIITTLLTGVPKERNEQLEISRSYHYHKRQMLKGKQKYLTYKNNFNQSKYYEKYLKYKLKYNQLKEKFN